MGGKSLKAYLYDWSQSQVLLHGVAETWNLKSGFRFYRTALRGKRVILVRDESGQTCSQKF